MVRRKIGSLVAGLALVLTTAMVGTGPATADEPIVTTPDNIRADVAITSATLEWDPSVSREAEISHYAVRVAGRWHLTTEPILTVLDLRMDQSYQVVILARDEANNQSELSEPFFFTTPDEFPEDFEPPAAPENLELQFDSRGRSFLATWDASQGTGPFTYHFQIDGQEVDETRELELEVFDFVRCGQFTGPPFDVTVFASAHGFESPESNPVEVCFG